MDSLSVGCAVVLERGARMVVEVVPETEGTQVDEAQPAGGQGSATEGQLRARIQELEARDATRDFEHEKERIGIVERLIAQAPPEKRAEFKEKLADLKMGLVTRQEELLARARFEAIAKDRDTYIDNLAKASGLKPEVARILKSSARAENALSTEAVDELAKPLIDDAEKRKALADKAKQPPAIARSQTDSGGAVSGGTGKTYKDILTDIRERQGKGEVIHDPVATARIEARRLGLL